ncbi:hypothetical protein C8R45DRAFT_521178 [Mycena sanguinolenta]|nr:hypothetical protein C8R45DRAFT_521178 [Mycena sanguinolenta]
MDVFHLHSSCRALRLATVYQRCPRRSLVIDATSVWSSPVLKSRKPKSDGFLILPDRVNTLDPRRIERDHYLYDISHDSRQSLNKHFRKMRSRQLPDPHGRQFGNQISTSNTLFPPDARGYLYYHSPSSHCPLAGGLRFRVTEERSPEGFLAGHDLLMSHGLPWHIPICEIVSLPTYSNILKLLIQDGFAPPVLQRTCKFLNVARDSVFIPALGVPWAVDWSTEFSRVYFVRQNDHPTPALVRHPWYAKHTVRRAPYSGRGLVSVIKNSDGELCLRIEKVLNLKQHGINHKAVAPVEGLVIPLSVRLIHKSTKISEQEMDKHSNRVLYPVSQLPWYPANPDPFDVYRWSEDILQDVLPGRPRTRTTSNPAQPALRDAPPHPAGRQLPNAPTLGSAAGVQPAVRLLRPTDSLPNTPPHHHPQNSAPGPPLPSRFGDSDSRSTDSPAYPQNSRAPPLLVDSRYYPRPTGPEPWAAPPPTEGSVWATGLSARLRASRNAEARREEAWRASSPLPEHPRNSNQPDRTPRRRWH